MELKGKKVGLITNHTGLNQMGISTVELLKAHARDFTLVALFAPEHGFKGGDYAGREVKNKLETNQLPIYSLFGETRRPTKEMLEGIDVLIYDIQDIGVRSYTYATTLFYCMEEAAKYQIDVIVLDRPNPINGLLVDGGGIEETFRSFIGYINVPYCHGMTIGELASFFNEEYRVGCRLKVIPMKGWRRSMSFKETGLAWIPTSPHIPEPDTPLFYASTGILGELELLSNGVGYTLPFKVVGAPWIKADQFASKLNAQKLPGVHFAPFHYRPFYGSLKGRDCHGVLIQVTDLSQYRPLRTQYLILGMLKSLYPEKVTTHLAQLKPENKKRFCFANGNQEIFRLLKNERYATWKMMGYRQKEREIFEKKRKKYLISEYLY